MVRLANYQAMFQDPAIKKPYGFSSTVRRNRILDSELVSLSAQTDHPHIHQARVMSVMLSSAVEKFSDVIGGVAIAYPASSTNSPSRAVAWRREPWTVLVAHRSRPLSCSTPR